MKIETRIVILYNKYSMTTIYILRLAGGNYYVGKTTDFTARLQAHMDRRACTWTTKHPVVSVERVLHDADPFEEDKQVKIYMAKHGIQKVRGGAYVTEVLSGDQLAVLKHEIWGAMDLCTTCGRKGHYAKGCFATSTIDGDPLVYACDDSSDDDDACFRCGRTGHWSRDCYAQTDVYGDFIDDDSDDSC